MPDVIDDARTLRKFKDKCASQILMTHTLEHIPPSDLFKCCRSMYRVLIPGGRLTVIVPHATGAIYAHTNGDLCFAELQRVILGSDPCATKYMPHFSIFNKQKLYRTLAVAGFVRCNIYNNDEDWTLKAVCYTSGGVKNATRSRSRRNR